MTPDVRTTGGVSCGPPAMMVAMLCRWIRFEENVEEGGERWSKPHVATLSLHALFELRRGMTLGTIMLDAEFCVWSTIRQGTSRQVCCFSQGSAATLLR